MSFAIDRNLALARQTDVGRWSNAAALEAAWEARAAAAADLIPAGSRVLDIGCGAMTLRAHLPAGCDYQGCDLVARAPDTIVCDLNAGAFPTAVAAEADVVSLLGVIEYVLDPEALFAALRQSRADVVLSYCVRDFTGLVDRASLGWLNALSLEELAVLFDRFGFHIVRAERFDDLQVLMKLRQGSPAPALPPCRAAVISYNSVGNFGDRLGLHVVNGLLPPHAEVTHLTFPMLKDATESYDLVVLGMGNSLFAQTMSKSLLAMLERAKVAVGIFGTQYREAIPRPAMNQILDRLDTWFARFEEDALCFGRGRDNVVHLGDWLVTQFPMTHGTATDLMQVGEEICEDLPLDRTIQRIQRHRNVFSARLHPLLCALTSAELVAYAEQREAPGTAAVSGKFRSLLMDVFGRTFPERKFFEVDRDAVARYKARVETNTRMVAARLGEIAAAL